MSGFEPLTPSLRATPKGSTPVYDRPPVGTIDLQIGGMLLGLRGQA
jgi:hypothetical protein